MSFLYLYFVSLVMTLVYQICIYLIEVWPLTSRQYFERHIPFPVWLGIKKRRYYNCHLYLCDWSQRREDCGVDSIWQIFSHQFIPFEDCVKIGKGIKGGNGSLSFKGYIYLTQSEEEDTQLLSHSFNLQAFWEILYLSQHLHILSLLRETFERNCKREW